MLAEAISELAATRRLRWKFFECPGISVETIYGRSVGVIVSLVKSWRQRLGLSIGGYEHAGCKSDSPMEEKVAVRVSGRQGKWM